MERPQIAAATEPSAKQRERLLARQVVGSRYIFPRLLPAAGVAWTLALAGREQCTPDYLVERASYPFHVLEVVVAGNGRVRLGRNRTQAIGPGSVFVYAPRMPCRIETDPARPLVKFFFALAGRAVALALKKARLLPGKVHRLWAPAEVVTMAEYLLHEGQRHSSRTPELCQKWMELLLLKIGEASDGRQAGEQRARENFLRCRALIDAEAAQLGSLEAVARQAGMNPASICRLFRRFQGTSPYRYLVRRKMSLAAEYLIESRGLVKEAAARVGFADPYHFTRCFKAVHGVPPSQVNKFRL